MNYTALINGYSLDPASKFAAAGLVQDFKKLDNSSLEQLYNKRRRLKALRQSVPNSKKGLPDLALFVVGQAIKDKGGIAENLKVTDHALVRYLERVEGIDVEGIRKAVAENLTLRHRPRIKNNAVITVLGAQ